MSVECILRETLSAHEVLGGASFIFYATSVSSLPPPPTHTSYSPETGEVTCFNPVAAGVESKPSAVQAHTHNRCSPAIHHDTSPPLLPSSPHLLPTHHGTPLFLSQVPLAPSLAQASPSHVEREAASLGAKQPSISSPACERWPEGRPWMKTCLW